MVRTIIHPRLTLAVEPRYIVADEFESFDVLEDFWRSPSPLLKQISRNASNTFRDEYLKYVRYQLLTFKLKLD